MEQAATWVVKVVEALGRAPQTPEEALGVLGALLRSNPAEKEEFIRQAHLAWVGGGWAVKGDPSPEARVVLMALVEATRRLAERYGWKRGGSSPRLRVTEEVALRVKIGEVGARGSNVFRVGPNGLSQKALWRAAYLVAQGEEVLLTGPLAAKARQLVLAKAAKVLAKAKARDVVRMPWGEEVPLLRGDRWEDLSLSEPRIATALRELQELLEERRQEEEVEVEEAREPWAHQVQVSPVALKRLWEEVDPEAREVESVYLRDQLEVLDLLDGVEVDVYHPGELHRVLGITPGSRPRRPEGWRRVLEEVVRTGRLFTFGEVREVFVRKGGRDWALYRLLQAPVAWEVETLGFKDPEAAFQEGILKGLLIGRRWRLGEVNPMVYLLAEVRKHLLELRAREVGVFQIPWEKARAVRRYFALVHKHGLSSEEAAKRAGLPPEVREALVGGKELSVQAFLEVGVDPTGEEVDYDTYLLRRKVEELRVEVRGLWGAPGEEFFELLLDGVAPYAAAYQLGLGAEFAEEVVAYLRNELESWVD